MKSKNWPVFFYFLAAFCAPFAHANEEFLGQLGLEDFYLEPGFRYEDKGKGGFTLGRSLLAARWQQDPVFSGRLAVGSEEVLGRTAFAQPVMTAAEKRKLGVVEAYGEADTGYGRVLLGLIPIRFGYEGSYPESRLKFPPSQLYTKRIVPRRDTGFSYSVTNLDYTSYLAVHNGESGEDVDNRLWLTGRFAWKGAARSEYGFSGMVGRYLDPATAEEYRVRIGNIFVGLDVYRLTVILEGSVAAIHKKGELFSETAQAHLDLAHPLSNLIGLLLRYDWFDPNHAVDGDQTREITLGLFVNSRYKTSTLNLTGTKVVEEGLEVQNDYFMVSWRLTPWLIN